MAADLAESEQIAIGAAAERKQRREDETQIDAILTSDHKGGRAVYWRRSIRGRDSVEVERAGTYSARSFLRLAEKAAGQAGKGRWNRPEAVEAVAAELVARTMAKTGGTLPVRGSLGKESAGHENPDLAYLTVAARRLIVSAQRGDTDAAGLAAEAAPVADAIETESADLSLSDLMAESEAAAEGPRDAYLADPPQPGADLLSVDTRAAANEIGRLAGERPAACAAAICAALRTGVAKSADLADAGYGASPGSVRKAAERGRKALRRSLAHLVAKPVSTWNALDWARAEAVASLCEREDAERCPPHVMEGSPTGTYRPRRLAWRERTQPAEPAPVRIFTVSQGGE